MNDAAPPQPPPSTLRPVRDYLTLDEAAHRLGLPVEELYQLVRHGEILGALLPEPRAWWVDRASLEDYQQRTSTEPPS